MLTKGSKNKYSGDENTTSFTDTSTNTTPVTDIGPVVSPTIEEQQAKTINKLQAENEELKKLTPKNSDDIAPGIRKTKTFEANYRNGYEDGSVARAIQADKEKQAAEMQVET